MRLHHIGIAVQDIESGIEEVEKFYTVVKKSPIIKDDNQNAFLCMLELEDGSRIELVAGEVVKNIVKKQKIYHACYEVENLDERLCEMQKAGAMVVSPPKQAVLFNNRRVAFLATPVGLVELLEA